MIDFLRRAYRAVVPEPLRRRVRMALAEQGYGHGFFDYLDSLQRDSYPRMAATLVRLLDPRDVVDVGCGSGGLLAALRAAGVAELAGFEQSAAALARCRRLALRVTHADLCRPVDLGRGHDLVISLEVAEHLPAASADTFVETLTGAAAPVLFSAATPGQGGEEHVNEQPHEYWIERFARRGYSLDGDCTRAIREEWRRGAVAPWYANNVMLFRPPQARP